MSTATVRHVIAIALLTVPGVSMSADLEDATDARSVASARREDSALGQVFAEAVSQSLLLKSIEAFSAICAFPPGPIADEAWEQFDNANSLHGGGDWWFSEGYGKMVAGDLAFLSGELAMSSGITALEMGEFAQAASHFAMAVSEFDDAWNYYQAAGPDFHNAMVSYGAARLAYDEVFEILDMEV